MKIFLGSDRNEMALTLRALQDAGVEITEVGLRDGEWVAWAK